MPHSIITLMLIALLAPLVSSTVCILATRRLLFKGAGYLTTAVMAGALACSIIALFTWLGTPVDQRHALVLNIPWIPLPGFGPGHALYLGILADPLTMAMMPMVTGISTLVHIYSIGYMHGDKRYNLFFAYLSLFTFSMLGIVLANSVIMLFVFWELVGLTSYLLIGFWFEKRGPQLACKKAFVMNRIGDAGFLVGFGILFYKLGGAMLLPATADSGSMFNVLANVLAAEGHSLANPPLWLTVAGIGLFFGAIGKSAQFPLHTWLPDAMEGPTPVSSIVHSATMVAAGVYLTGRIYPILTPGAHLFISTIGLVTLVMAAFMAMVMTDIKRVLAYSTLSQLGYMVLGMGVGAWTFALFHLITHAFFKCCLFQCSGSVIHAAHHQQDMRHYGGLGKKMPITMACYAICTLAIAGASIPFTTIAMSGFFSKDGIIAGSISYGDVMAHAGYLGKLFWLGPIVIAYVTPFYMGRSFALTFLGKPRDQHLHDHAHEAPLAMWFPQVCLAIMAIASGYLGWKTLILGSEAPMLAQGVAAIIPGEVIEAHHSHGMHMTHALLLSGFGWIIALGAGILMYVPGMAISSRIVKIPGVNLLYTWALNKFYFDALYDVFTVSMGKFVAVVCAAVDKYLVDGLVNLAGSTVREIAMLSGKVDKHIVDGGVNGVAAMAQGAGDMLRSTQPGKIRIYVLMFFSSAALVTLLVVISAIALR
ncbi:MAG: NADH-quinone oxidoreductase subunit L [Phycisphaera sp.]|nr:NADH-quinone oxidoreductase subunit L [Phycisphaera sp.]